MSESFSIAAPIIYETTGDTLYVVARNEHKYKSDGSFYKPFTTIQEAINRATEDNPTVRKTILIESGIYDEDLTIEGAVLLSLVFMGPSTLGDAAGTNFASISARNITWNIGGYGGSPRPTLKIICLGGGEVSSTHPAYGTGLEISGNLVVTDSNAVNVSHELHLTSVKIKGNLTATQSAGGCNLYIEKCYLDQALTATVGLMWMAVRTQFDGLVTLQQVGRVSECEFLGGMTVTSTTPMTSGLPPNGMFNTKFSGVFTGPATSLWMDSTTNYFFKTLGASKAGGATTVLLSDNTPA